MHPYAGYIYKEPANVAGGDNFGFAYNDPRNTGYSGGGQAHNNMQPSLNLNYMVKI